MTRIPLLLMFAAVGCSAGTPLHVEVVGRSVPDVDDRCTAPAPDPVYPPKIMSVEALRLFAQEADAARIHDKAALVRCAAKLHKAVAVLDAVRTGQMIP